MTIWKDAAFNLSVSLLAIFIVTLLLLGFNFFIASILTFTIAMTVLDMFGAMYILNIELNAVSLVNLVIVSDDAELVTGVGITILNYSVCRL